MQKEPPVLVQLNEVSKVYGDHMVQALSGINLSVRAGEFLAIMGPSGCGKSTLLNIIGGIDHVSGGDLFFDGQNMSSMTDEQLTKLRRTQVGFIFQFFNLLSTLTVEENCALPLELASKSSKAINALVATILADVGMSQRAKFYPAQLSGGEMQRVAIARALIHSPSIVVADEPTGNLDSENGEAILKLIKGVNKEKGRTIVLATHSAEAAAYADRLIVMRDGCIVGEQECCPRP